MCVAVDEKESGHSDHAVSPPIKSHNQTKLVFGQTRQVCRTPSSAQLAATTKTIVEPATYVLIDERPDTAVARLV